jgi:uncharacterized protein (TIGR00369 family)
MVNERVELPKVEGYNCFACGTANPIGLNLHFYRNGETVCTDITLGKYHVGWQNMAHGGILSTMLDEVMSWTIIYFKRVFFVTRKMDLKYIKPVMIGVPLTVKGRILEEGRHNTIRVAGEIFDDQGKILARSTGQFVILPKERLDLVPEDLKEEMQKLFELFGDTPSGPP